MRDISDAFAAAIAANKLSTCEIYEITLALGTTYYFTSHNEDIDWGTPSIRYKALPIQRSTIKSAMNLEADSVELVLRVMCLILCRFQLNG